MSPVLKLLLKVDAGDYHFRTRASLTSADRALAEELVVAGLLRVMKRTPRFPKRYVVTREGSVFLGTFDVIEPHTFPLPKRRAA